MIEQAGSESTLAKQEQREISLEKPTDLGALNASALSLRQTRQKRYNSQIWHIHYSMVAIEPVLKAIARTNVNISYEHNDQNYFFLKSNAELELLKKLVIKMNYFSEYLNFTAAAYLYNFYRFHSFPPYLTFLIKLTKDYPRAELDKKLSIFSLNQEEVTTAADYLNNFIKLIKTEMSSRAFKNKTADLHKLSLHRDTSIKIYIRQLAWKYKRLHVMRFELAYQSEGNISGQPSLKALDEDSFNTARHECSTAWNQFLKWAKRDPVNAKGETLFKNALFVGYIAKLEYGCEKGFTYHVIFFFVSVDFEQFESEISENLKQLWLSLTSKGQGDFFECNEAQGYRFAAIGPVTSENFLVDKGLIFARHYMTKTDYYLKLKAPGRVFYRGELIY